MRISKQGSIALLILAASLIIISFSSCSTTRNSLYKKNNLTNMQRKYKIQDMCINKGIHTLDNPFISKEWNFDKKYTKKQKRLGKHYLVGYNNVKTKKKVELFAR